MRNNCVLQCKIPMHAHCCGQSLSHLWSSITITTVDRQFVNWTFTRSWKVHLQFHCQLSLGKNDTCDSGQETCALLLLLLLPQQRDFVFLGPLSFLRAFFGFVFEHLVEFFNGWGFFFFGANAFFSWVYNSAPSLPVSVFSETIKHHVNWILFSFFCLLLYLKKKGMLQLRFWASFKQISLNTDCSAENGSYSTHWMTKHSSLWPVLYRAIWSALQYFLTILYTYSEVFILVQTSLKWRNPQNVCQTCSHFVA